MPRRSGFDPTTAEMAALRARGWTLERIGAHYGMTRQAVYSRFRKAAKTLQRDARNA